MLEWGHQFKTLPASDVLRPQYSESIILGAALLVTETSGALDGVDDGSASAAMLVLVLGAAGLIGDLLAGGLGVVRLKTTVIGSAMLIV